MEKNCFTIKQGSRTKKVKAGSYDELCAEASKRFSVVPNTFQLKFKAPNGKKVDLDN